MFRSPIISPFGTPDKLGNAKPMFRSPMISPFETPDKLGKTKPMFRSPIITPFGTPDKLGKTKPMFRSPIITPFGTPDKLGNTRTMFRSPNISSYESLDYLGKNNNRYRSMSISSSDMPDTPRRTSSYYCDLNYWNIGPLDDDVFYETVPYSIESTKEFYVDLLDSVVEYINKQDVRLFEEKNSIMMHDAVSRKDYHNMLFHYFEDMKLHYHNQLSSLLKYGKELAEKDPSYTCHIINKEDVLLKAFYRIIISLHNGAEMLKNSEDEIKLGKRSSTSTGHQYDITISDQFLKSCTVLKDDILSMILRFGDKCAMYSTMTNQLQSRNAGTFDQYQWKGEFADGSGAPNNHHNEHYLQPVSGVPPFSPELYPLP